MSNGISVIIPTYNLSSLLPRTIRSALAATTSADEVLVIDDGSTDDTPAVVEQFASAIRYIRVQKNSGRCAARNLGISLAERPLVAFLDHDDEWAPDKLVLQRRVMERFPEVVFCFSNLLAKFSDGRIAHDVLGGWRVNSRVGYADSPAHLSSFLGPGVPFSSMGELPAGRADFSVLVGDMYPALMEVLYATSSAVMVRKELAGAVLRFDERLPLMEDWDLAAKLSKLGPAAYLDCELAVQGVHEGPRGTNAPEIVHATVRIGLLEDIWGADEEFLNTHSARYRSLLKTQYVRRAKLRISEGHLDEARKDLAACGGPVSYSIIASLPPLVVRSLLGVKRSIQARGRSTRSV